MNGGQPDGALASSRFHQEFGDADDPFGVFREFGGPASARAASAAVERARSAMPGARRWMRSGSRRDASPQEVKTRFKTLVKRHHPDANGGDRSSEDKLREIIQAYNYLKSIGFR